MKHQNAVHHRRGEHDGDGATGPSGDATDQGDTEHAGEDNRTMALTATTPYIPGGKGMR
jgi:hypothetical protein